jgi:hypothetical protein
MLAKEIQVRNRRFSPLLESAISLAVVLQLIVAAFALKVHADEVRQAAQEKKTAAAHASVSSQLTPPATTTTTQPSVLRAFTVADQTSVTTPEPGLVVPGTK